jgi:hypothetical protein
MPVNESERVLGQRPRVWSCSRWLGDARGCTVVVRNSDSRVRLELTRNSVSEED